MERLVVKTRKDGLNDRTNQTISRGDVIDLRRIARQSGSSNEIKA